MCPVWRRVAGGDEGLSWTTKLWKEKRQFKMHGAGVSGYKVGSWRVVVEREILM